jgi:hypothetical protein
MDETENTPSSPAPTTSARSSMSASAARAKAAARRRRILEQSKDRIDLVSGLAPHTTTTTTTDNVDSNPNETTESTVDFKDDAVDENVDATTVMKEETTTVKGDTDVHENNDTTLDNENNDDKEADNATDENVIEEKMTTVDEKQPISGAKRLAQLRKRRFQKAQEAKEKLEETEAKNETSDVTIATETRKEEFDQDNHKPTPQEASSSSSQQDQLQQTVEEPKKYLGVAKMRRKMLAEKKAMEDDNNNNLNSTTVENSIFGSVGNKKAESTPFLFISTTQKMNVYINLFTILLLFLVGFDVGLQNHYVVKQSVPHVYDTVSLLDNGIGLFSIFTPAADVLGLKSGDKIYSNVIITDYTNDDTNDELLDEFDTLSTTTTTKDKSQPRGADSDQNTNDNIDPLFRIDLDKATAGPGILKAAARVAVSIHRKITFVCWTLPLSIIYSILFALPKRLLSNPPILFLSAVLIRFLGKHILGGGRDVPTLDSVIEVCEERSFGSLDAGVSSASSKMMDDAGTSFGGEKSKDGGKDLVSMAKRFVFNFLKNTFPNTFLAYTVFKDARSDMLIVLCGLFVGLSFPVPFMDCFSLMMKSFLKKDDGVIMIEEL